MTDDAAPDGLNIDALAAILKREYDQADSYSDQLATLTDQAFKYYEAQPFGNEVEGRSQIVLPDVQETIDYMAASVIRTFVSGDRTVEFEATDESDEVAAQEATAAINHLFMRKQDGYRILLDTVNEGLLRKIGVFKTAVETVEKVSRETVIAPLEALLMQLPEGAEIESADEQEDGTVKATIKTERIEKRFVDYSIPMRRFKFSPNATHEDTADYLCHAEPKTRSALVEMGFDREQVYSLPGYTNEWQDSTQSELDNHTRDDSSEELQEVLLCEEYARIDIDGDGIAERVKVYRVENEILIDAETGEPSIEQVDEQPFAVFCPFPRPHRMVGYSLAEKVMDIQLARSFVARQLFDGMAFANMPRPIVDMQLADADTINDLLSPIPGSPIRARGGAAAVQPFQTGFDVSKTMTALEWLTGERESRTGITRLNQGLDADALNKTATGTALMQSQGQQAEEFIARNLAEAVSRLFLKKYRLLRAEGEPMKVKVDGRYKLVDPSLWPDDICITIHVGLGSGSKDKRIQYRMALMQPMAEGMSQGLVTGKHAFNMIDGLVRDMGIGQGDDYWVDPDSEDAPQPQEKPDPEMLKLQAEQQKAEAQLQLDREKAVAQVDTERMKAQANIDMMREKHALEMQQKREQAEQEADLARERMMIEAQLEREALEMRTAAQVEIGRNRPGGALDA